MKLFSKSAAVIAFFLINLSTNVAPAQQFPSGPDLERGRRFDEPGPGSGFAPRHGPPPEFFRACEGKTAGSAVQVTLQNGEKIDGTCVAPEARLIFRPNHPKKGTGEGRPAPPPEAYKACEGKIAGSPAQFTGPRGEAVKGTCEDLNGKLVLRPDFLKREGRGGLPGRRQEHETQAQ